MNNQEFEKKYLNKNVVVEFFDGDIKKGILKKSVYWGDTEPVKNLYTLGDTHFHFRKYQIKKIKELKND